jgi:hypothetical protein
MASLAFASAAHAQITDITVNNGISTSPSNYNSITPSSYGADPGGDFNTNADPRIVNSIPVLALGYVNSGDVPDKSWDLEALGYQASSHALTYVGGFNPMTADEGYNLGDIFLSPGPVPQTGGTAGGGNTNPSIGTYPNPGYTYAIHITSVDLTTSTLTYSIYQLTTGAAVLDTVAYNNYQNNPLSDPYALDLNGVGYTTVASGLTTHVSTDTNTQVNQLLNETGAGGTTELFTEDDGAADNYVTSFDLSSIGSQNLTSFDASLTEECGNDLIKGAYPGPGENLVATPEPKSIYLTLVAAAFFVYIYRLFKRFQVKRLPAALPPVLLAGQC